MAEIRRNLDNEFALRRDKALRDVERRKEEARDRIPELARLDAEITLSGLRYARSLLNGTSSGGEEKLSEQINELNNRMKALLLARGFAADYLEPHFSCPLCEDRGYVTQSGATTPCSCYHKLYLEQLYNYSNLLDDGKTGFEFFNASYFSDKPIQGNDSPREQILSIKEQSQSFIDHFSDAQTPNYYFYGPTGTGKTFMAKSIGLELVKKGYSVLYLSAPSLFSIIHQYRLNPDRDEVNGEQAYKNLITANLLILDDLGTEPGSDARYAELLTLLEMRKARGRDRVNKTIISSNLDLRILAQVYNERIASRIVGEFQTLKFFGEDIRVIKKMEKLS